MHPFASVETQYVLNHMAAVVGTITLTGALFGAIWWIFGPRIKGLWHAALQPITERIDAVEKQASKEHDHLAMVVEQRWVEHDEIHDELGRAIGRIEGGQDAMLAHAGLDVPMREPWRPAASCRSLILFDDEDG